MGNKSLTTVDRSSSILDRASIQTQPLTQIQALADQLVSVSIQEGTNLKTAAAMLGAGWVGRASRIGALTSLPSHAVFRGASYVPALAAESAAFAGIERGFHPSAQPFQKEWAKAAVTLTGLKVFGGMSRGQNVVLQHLLTDLGLVGGQHAGYIAGLTERPQGSFAEQMLQAEITNWHMKGSMAFAHAFSPRLSATEKSLEIFLRGQEGHLFSQGEVSHFFWHLAAAVSGGRGHFSESPQEGSQWRISSGGEGNGGPKAGKNTRIVPAKPEPAEQGESPEAKILRDIQEAKGLHREAMKISHSAITARRRGLEAELEERVRAFELEKRASDLQPLGTTRTFYQFTAAGLAMECGKFSEAEGLMKKALEENPPTAEMELLKNYMNYKITGIGKKREAELTLQILFDFYRELGVMKGRLTVRAESKILKLARNLPIQVTDLTFPQKDQQLVSEGYRLTNAFSMPAYSRFVEYRAELEKRKVDYKVLALAGPEGSKSEMEYIVFERL